MNKESSDSPGDILRLLDIMEKLRAENGCPWDREQNLASLKQYMIEECYEVVDAIDAEDVDRHREELGDLLLQVVFQAQIRNEQNEFGFPDVVECVCAKLIRRHPHVFADTHVDDTEQVLKNWEAIKAREKSPDSGDNVPGSAMDGIPNHLPALHKAHHVQKRAARVGFDWSRLHDVVDKVHEELREVEEALASRDADKTGQEIGDLLFAVVNLARFQRMNPEELLNSAVRKFMRRFQSVETGIRENGKELSDCTLEEMDEYWEAVKKQESG